MLHSRLIITLHAVKGKRLKKAHSPRNTSEMPESEEIMTAVIQMAIQAATTAVMVMREADAGPTLGTNMVNLGEVHRHRTSWTRQPLFNWNFPGKYYNY